MITSIFHGSRALFDRRLVLSWWLALERVNLSSQRGGTSGDKRHCRQETSLGKLLRLDTVATPHFADQACPFNAERASDAHTQHRYRPLTLPSARYTQEASTGSLSASKFLLCNMANDEYDVSEIQNAGASSH